MINPAEMHEVFTLSSVYYYAICARYCHILGFPGNATMKQTCPHNNETDASIQQCKQAVIEFHSNELRLR
jgi:hypothetical protein